MLGLAAALALLPAGTGLPPDVGTVPQEPATPGIGPPSSAGAPPTVIELPTLDVTAPVVPVGVDAAGALAVPDDPGEVGWWSAGAAPGSSTGTVILAGHVDGAQTGPGALFRLYELDPGATIVVHTTAGTYRYSVTARRSYAKQQLPASLFDSTVRGRLVVVTCTGEFHNGRYTDNLVVYAEPA